MEARQKHARHYESAEVEQLLAAAGVQPTLQRIAIFRHILCDADHPTADDIYQWAEKKLEKISQATVYNTLGTLVDAGLLQGLRLAHSEKVIYDDNLEDHFHFLDEKTGKLYDLDPGQVEVKYRLPRKFRASHIEVIIKGKIET